MMPKFKVTAKRTTTVECTVEAANQDSARQMAERLEPRNQGWRDHFDDELSDIEVTPEGRAIETGVHGIVVYLTGDGGWVDSDLHQDRDADDNPALKAALDAIESIVLAHAIAGIDITTPAYKEGINTSVESAVNALD